MDEKISSIGFDFFTLSGKGIAMEKILESWGFLQLLEDFNEMVRSVVWGPLMLLLMAFIGLYFTLRTRFFQFTKLGKVLRHTLMGKREKGAEGTVSPLQATSTALAGTMGTGNIVGIATAITAGGAGAVFWMWVSAFLGMMTKYAEIVLAVKFREKNDAGELVGGPMYYIEKGLGQKWLAVLFAVFCTLASFGIGNMTQVNAISQTLSTSFGIEPLLSGVVCAVLVGFVILGGMKRIAGITSAIVPLLSVFYIAGALAAICFRASALPEAFSMIFSQAFEFRSVGGGVLGYGFSQAVRFGFSRGVFSNEAGLGSAPIAHASSHTEEPAEQGLWGIFEVFADTIVVCTLTALVILTSGVFGTGNLDGADLTAAAFSQSLGKSAGIFLSVSVSLFAFATLIGWCYYGERCVEYLFHSRRAVLYYRSVYVVLIVLGAVMELHLVWDISDTLNGCMAIPNLIAVLGLSGIVLEETKRWYLRYGKST